MNINQIELTTLAKTSLQYMQSTLVDLVLHHYDELEMVKPTDLLFGKIERAIKRDSFKLLQVNFELNRRFQDKVLTVLEYQENRIVSKPIGNREKDMIDEKIIVT